ncbi:hypothetical protein GCM10010277_45240 [Streptomyces longisporoflavus]|nr:hypothetical protein GCM10010277_45240 [Streptomyces longisporoflavus]
MIDGDPGPGRLAREEARGRTQQIPGVHQDDAAVHAIHPLSLEIPWKQWFGFSSSLPDPAEVNGRNSIFGVAYRHFTLRQGFDRAYYAR